MTDPQLMNNNNNNNSSNNNNNNNNNSNTYNNNINTSGNNNNDGEPKYLHKKFKKMATTEMVVPVEEKKENSVIINTTIITNTSSSTTIKPNNNEIINKKRESVRDTLLDSKESSRVEKPTIEPDTEPIETRKAGYVCPYCKLSCAKPSVLQKHIRAHTNERPYPCIPCGFAFKTKSNLYKHCRSRAHALKMEGGDGGGKVSEDSDISLSDSASNGTGTPPPLVPSSLISTSSSSSSSSSSAINASSNTKTVKTGKIYKPKFHTDLQCLNNDNEISSSITSNSSSNNSTIITTINNNNKPNVEKLQEHIDKIITDNQAIVDAVDPRLHKLMQRQQSLVEQTKPCSEQPLNLSSVEETISRKRCYSESFAQETDGKQQATEGSIIKDLLLKNRELSNTSSNTSDENFVCQSCKIAYTSVDNLETHLRYYCKGPSMSSPNRDFQLDLERRDERDKPVDYYNTVQPLPSPGPLLGNTRLVDTYAPQMKKTRSESVPTTLRSLEELSKYPRPNSLQMFGGEVRILDNTGETKTMRIEPRQTNSPSNDHGIINPKCTTSETSSIVVRSGLHSGGTMVHKPPGTPAVTTTSTSISLPNTPKMLAPIIPNISTPNLAPTMSCYNYLESHLNPLTSITAYNPLTLPQAGITNILHGGKVIPYVPGMPGPHTLSATPAIDISHVQSSGNVGYKVIPGIPGLHIISQPLNLASPVIQTSNNISSITETGNVELNSLGRPLDCTSPIKESKYGVGGCKNTNGLPSPKISRCLPSRSTPTSEISIIDLDRQVNQTNYMIDNLRKEIPYEKSPSKFDRNYHQPNYSNGIGRLSPRMTTESRKRPGDWSDVAESRSHHARYDSPPPPSSPSSSHTSSTPSSPLSQHENGRVQISPDEIKHTDSYNAIAINGRLQSESTPVIMMNMDSSNSESMAGLTYEKLENKVFNISDTTEISTKFLRPTSLPLKPGTFTPKRHHGITPTANTLPLISPETPRPKKSYGQLYLNGHAYTYLGLKCSTRVFYCTLNRPQPMYVTQQHGLSMYSNWKICKEAPPDLDMAHYDSRHRPANYSIAWKPPVDILIHSSYRPTTPTSPDSGLESDTQEKSRRVKIFDGGFESNEDYTYVRGRGRGRYVCEECGIRCKKPSMLKKHIRTHTDVRPYTCKHCAFSFKTKGNLTKHMKSKAHYKKCVQLGINPVPTTVCDENIDKEAIARLAAGGGNADDSSEEEDETDGDDSEESGSEEHEAAQSLLSLSKLNPKIITGLISSVRPSTYPYALTFPSTSVTTSIVATIASVAASTCVTTTTTVIQNEVPHRYYFPSSRSSSEECRDSVIRSSKTQETDSQMEHDDYDGVRHHQQLSQPIDLTTKTPLTASLTSFTPLTTPIVVPTSTVIHRSMVADILTPVSEPVLLQTIVQTMDRLPPQGREWKPDADGHMLQAYLTERHVMDSKMKQQYRVGTFKFEKKLQTACKTDNGSSHDVYSSSTSTVTYTDPSKMQQMVTIVRDRSKDELKLEMRSDTRPFEIESYHCDKESTNARLSSLITTGCIDHASIIRNNKSPLDKTSYIMEMNNRASPKGLLKSECELGADGDMMINTGEFRPNPILSESTKIQSSISPNRDIVSSYDRPPSQEFKVPCQEFLPTTKDVKDHIGNFDIKLPSQAETRVDYKPEHRNQILIDIQPMEPPKLHDISLAVTGNTKCTERPEIKINNVDITKQGIVENLKHNVARKMVVGGPGFRSPSPPGRSTKPQAEFLQPTNGCTPNYISVNEDGRSVCGICNKIFSKPSQLRLHINIHYFERPFRCESCAVSFRTKGHLTKHERSVSHHNKVSMTSTFGAATTSNPRPFKCTDCKIAFRIHGHLAKHLRSKMHIMKLECLGKLPFGTYAEMERSGINLNDIDTTDCDNSLNSLQLLAQKLYEKDPSKMSQWDAEMVPHHGTSGGETSSDEGEPLPINSMQQYQPRLPPEMEVATRAYHTPALVSGNNDTAPTKPVSESYVPNSRFNDNSLPYKCQICARSLRTVNELQVHCFVEHNIEGREKENMQKRIAQEVIAVGTSRDDQDKQKIHNNNEDI